uniref:4Fe-4S ferredoxin-type domain-containing protein n=1 Tax=Macrostomum lignano TaxID=282301 RepID=A0A1I8JEE7_9PLAT
MRTAARQLESCCRWCTACRTFCPAMSSAATPPERPGTAWRSGYAAC